MSQQRQTRGLADATDRRRGIFWGRVACVVGLISVLWGAFNISIAYEALGILLGAVGYALGAHRLGRATVVISVVMLIVVLTASQGYIPGVEPKDPRSRLFAALW
jgi:hypothetical protein